MALRNRTLIALLMTAITALSAAQAGLVSADASLTLQLFRAPTSTEPLSANGTVEVNLQSGELRIRVRAATPNAVYPALFASASTSSSVELGSFATNAEGEGELEATLSSGTYVGIFQIFRASLLQFISADASFTVTISATGTVSTTQIQTFTSQTTTSSVTSVTQTTTFDTQVEFKVEPSFRSISAGAFAKFDIEINTKRSVAANIFLVARAVPPNGVAIFTQNVGVADPEFHSTLTILTSTNTPAATHTVSVIALINSQEFEAQIRLEVTPPSTVTTQTSTSVTVSVGAGLSLTLSPDRPQYATNSTVIIQGHVRDDGGNAVGDANVSIQVDGPTGVEIVFLSSVRSDAAGFFQVSFRLAANAVAGTYKAFATASATGHTSATTHTTFVVGVSSTPSVIIKEVYVTDISGGRSTVFSIGQTVLVWVVVENSGATFEGVIWLQIRDPNGTPVWIQLQISTLATGQTVRVAFGFTVTANLVAGLYSAYAFVSDKLISQGGTFLASASAEFALTV